MNPKGWFFGRWRIFLSLSMIWVVKPVAAELVAELPQARSPLFMAVAAGRLYLIDDSCKIHSYNVKGRKVEYIKTFGHEGEGPGEFKWLLHLRVKGDHLEIPTIGKLARFSLDGQFLDEVKVPVRTFKNMIARIGDNYLVRDYQFDDTERITIIRLYGKDFKLIKEIGTRKEKRGRNRINLWPEVYSAFVGREKIYVVESGMESTVMVYNGAGERQEKIRLPLKPVKITSALKEVLLKPIREDPEMKAGWDEYEKRLHIPDYAPGLDFFTVTEDKWIVRTYNIRGNSVEFIIFNMTGKEMRRVFLPYTGRMTSVLFCFHQGRYYYLKENVDKESWELHSQKAWGADASVCWVPGAAEGRS